MENISKKKRGRPKLLDDSHLALVRYATDAKTTRHQQNVHYSLRAIGMLSNDPRFKWLCDGKAMMKGAQHSYRPTILAELGRIENDDDLKAVALRICKLKPKVRDAVVMIRRFRTGKVKEADSLQLANEILAIVNRYTGRYPETTAQQILTALTVARDAVIEAQA